MSNQVGDTVRLVRVLGGAETARVRNRLRERIARGDSLTGTISLAEPSAAERAAIDRLLGRRPSTGRSVTVPLLKLEAVLRNSGIWPAGLASAVVELGGPVTVRSEQRSAETAAWGQVTAPLRDLATIHPDLGEWYAGLESTGLLRRLTGSPDRAGPVVRDLCTVLSALPAPPQQLGRFAVEMLGNAHALDDGTSLRTLVFGAARVLGGAPDGSGAAWRRMVWASVGLARDELSSTVLTLGLPGDPATSTSRALDEWHATGQPVVLTLRQLRTEPPQWSTTGLMVSVCENPAVIAAAADRFGARTAPLVCTSGQPSAAALLLLDQLARAGARFRYHGDFDWYGIRIANFLRRHCRWVPWRFERDDYLTAAAAHEGRRLTGGPVTPMWDAALGEAMTCTGRQVEEEAVLDLLLDDLS
ncbi:TIGR02679 family protein [Nocardia vinacea]|uniref:TIGR02679 family protein n=1 Tax=Nocardia vinacea TaxID=96468 RepID=UPI003403789E